MFRVHRCTTSLLVINPDRLLRANLAARHFNIDGRRAVIE
jgi:hypothetical protein